MSNNARSRAESLFASLIKPANKAVKAPPPPSETEAQAQQNVEARPQLPDGPNTLHLRFGGQPVQTGWSVTKPRRAPAKSPPKKT